VTANTDENIGQTSTGTRWPVSQQGPGSMCVTLAARVGQLKSCAMTHIYTAHSANISWMALAGL